MNERTQADQFIHYHFYSLLVLAFSPSLTLCKKALKIHSIYYFLDSGYIFPMVFSLYTGGFSTLSLSFFSFIYCWNYNLVWETHPYLSENYQYIKRTLLGTRCLIVATTISVNLAFQPYARFIGWRLLAFLIFIFNKLRKHFWLIFIYLPKLIYPASFYYSTCSAFITLFCNYVTVLLIIIKKKGKKNKFC